MAKGSGTTRKSGLPVNFNGVSNKSLQTKQLEVGQRYQYAAKILGVDSDTAFDLVENYYKEYADTGHAKVYNNPYGKMANEIERFIDKAPKWAGGTTYRGLPTDSKAHINGELKVGSKISLHGISSWSTDLETAKSFTTTLQNETPTILVCRKPQNGTSWKKFNNANEAEILVSRRAQYRIASIKYSDDLRQYSGKQFRIIEVVPIKNKER